MSVVHFAKILNLLSYISLVLGTRIILIYEAVNSFKIHGDNTGIVFLFLNSMWFEWLSPQNPIQS